MNFSQDLALELFYPVLNNAGQTAFYGALTDAGVGLWSEGTGSLAAVARSGQQAPGTPSGVNFTFANLFQYLESPVLNDAGQTTFRTFVSGPGVNNVNLSGVWSEGSGSLALVARGGSPAPGLPAGVNHNVFYEAAMNDVGQTVFWVALTGNGVNNSNNFCIWSEASGSLALVARMGSAAPGMPGVTFDNMIATGAINNAGQVAVVAGLSSKNSQFNQDSIWLSSSGSITLLARRRASGSGYARGREL